jgi:AraC-like DNA-binding protein
MLESTNLFAKATSGASTVGILDDALRSLRISGTLLLRESYSTPWAIAIPRGDQLGTLLGLRHDTRAVAFHLVEFGHCEIKADGTNAMLLTAGDMAICFGGGMHRIAAGRPSKTQPVATLLSGGANTQHPGITGRPVGTSLICGVFLMHNTELNPLLSALPPVVHATLSRSGELHNLSGVARLLTDEIERSASGSSYVIERLLEVLCAEAVRAHIEDAPSQDVGWFRGIKDPVVGRAIAAIHASPGDDWSVSRLASQVAMSPSRFAARFSESLGASPMVYVTRWRMNVACRKLVASRLAVDQIAADVGYESPAAFNRAFKKLVGLPPAAWRARERQ